MSSLAKSRLIHTRRANVESLAEILKPSADEKLGAQAEVVMGGMVAFRTRCALDDGKRGGGEGHISSQVQFSPD